MDGSKSRSGSDDLARRFWLKFLLDRLVAAAGMPALGASVAAVWLAMLVESWLDPPSRGPVFYCEERWTQGRPFWVLKFRTTYPGRQEAGEVGQVTRMGAFLRRYYLDELPQLVNVLRGEMTLVGPRPNVPWKARREIEQEGMTSKLLLRAGLTGMVQVRKGEAQDRDLYRTLEDEYLHEVRQRNAWQVVLLDLKLLAQTIPFMIRGEGF